MTTKSITNTRYYPPKKIDIAEAFKLRYKNQLTFQDIADRFGCSKQAVMDSIRKFTALMPNPEEIELYRQNKVNILTGLESTLVCDMLDPERRKAASLNNTAYSFQQVATQNRLEQGLATERIDSFSVTASLSDLARRKQELMDKVMGNIQPVVLDVIPNPSITTDKQDK